MSARANSPAAKGPIILLEDDRPRASVHFASAFDERPCLSAIASPLLPTRSRLIDDAGDWAQWRTQRLGLEQALFVQESCRSLDPDTADRMRDRLAELERRVCDIRSEDIFSELSALQQKVLADLGETES